MARKGTLVTAPPPTLESAPVPGGRLGSVGPPSCAAAAEGDQGGVTRFQWRCAPILLLLLFAVAAWPGLAMAYGTSQPVVTDNVTARLVAERDRVEPGDRVDLALVLDIRPGWHTYWRNPGDSGEPPHIRWELPDGVTAGSIRWPWPELIRVGPLANYGYSGRAVHLVELRVPAEWPAGTPLGIAADATWLVCEEHCIPEEGRFRLRLEVAGTAGPPDPELAPIFAAARSRLPQDGVVRAALEPSGDVLTLRVPSAALPPDPQSARFFAGEWGLIEHAAPQDWTIDGDELVMTLTPGAAAASAAPAGLLVVAADGGTRAFEIDATAPPGAAAPAPDGGVAAGAGDGAGLGLPLALALALLGGLVLNLMPCVFPVLAIKALGLARQGGAPLRERALHGLAYTAGVLTFFALVAALLLALRAGGAAVGWGFQLQSPPFVALMAYLFLVLGLSLAGAVTLGTRVMGLGAGLHAGGGHAGAFVTGGLAALVAAPCTAPFMGAALGYALTLVWPLALAIILTLGLGLALPFLLLALLPALARRLPRPGPWMEHLKQGLAFPMFATAAWLVWVLSVQAGPAGVAAALTGMVLLAFGLWLLERTRHAAPGWRRGGAVAGAAALLLAVGIGLGTERLAGADLAAASGGGQVEPEGSGLAAEPFGAGRLAEALAAGRPVFVNMTAAWCITCLVNERVALGRPAVAAAFAERDLLYLKGDWTRRDPSITEYLAGFGRSGVPIYVLYPPGGEPRVLPQVLTESIVLDALDRWVRPIGNSGLALADDGGARE